MPDASVAECSDLTSLRERATRPLSICLYTDSSIPLIGGAQTVLDNLARQLVVAGHRPVVLSPASKTPFDDGKLPYPLVRYRRPVSKRYFVRLAMLRIAALHRRHRFDVLHCHAAYPQAFVGSWLKRVSGLPFVVRPHGSDILPGEMVRSHPRLNRRMRKALPLADAVIAQGEFLAQAIADVGVARERIHVIHNGVDVDEFTDDVEPFSHPRRYVLCMGRLVHHKGVDVLLRAFARLETLDADLLIAGDGRDKAAIHSVAEELNLNDRVRFIGPVQGETKVRLYRSALCCIVPSRREPYANVVLEAQASGLPVIASAVGGNLEMIVDGETGLLFPSEDDRQLATGIQRLVADAELQNQMKMRIAARIEAHAWHKVAQQYVDLYAQVSAKSRAA